MYFAQPEQYMSTPGILYDFKVKISNDNDFENPSFLIKNVQVDGNLYLYERVIIKFIFILINYGLTEISFNTSQATRVPNSLCMESCNVFHTV